MNLLIKFSAVLFLSMATSCDSMKTTTTSNKGEDINTINDMKSQLIADGYVAGTIKYQSESKCPYVIIDDSTQLKYDPINLDEEKYMRFKKDAEKVYFKYRPLRMMNRCNEAQPVELEDLKKREG